MRFQLLRFTPDGTPVAPLQEPRSLDRFNCTFNAEENRYEVDLTTMVDVVTLAAYEECIVRVVPVDGDATDLPILHLVDSDDNDLRCRPVERVCVELLTMRNVLRAIEWMGPGARTKDECGPLQGERCPYCHHAKEIGHSTGCTLDAMLQRGKGPL